MMKECFICETELSLLGLRYEKRFNQHICSRCNRVYLETGIGLIRRSDIESLEKLMDNRKFENLLNRLNGEINVRNKMQTV